MGRVKKSDPNTRKLNGHMGIPRPVIPLSSNLYQQNQQAQEKVDREAGKAQGLSEANIDRLVEIRQSNWNKNFNRSQYNYNSSRGRIPPMPTEGLTPWQQKVNQVIESRSLNPAYSMFSDPAEDFLVEL